MDVDGLYRSLIKDTGLPSIKAAWVERYVKSAISFWCDFYAPEDMRDPPDAFVAHLIEVGLEHQSNVTAESYPEAVEEVFYREEDGFRRTLELMAAGEKFIMNMPLICRNIGLEGRPDLLVRVDDIESDLGSYSYGVVEIKSARRITEAHILQGAVYNRMLGVVQGHEPDEFYIINRDSNERVIQASEVADKLDHTLENIRGVLDGAIVDACYGAAESPWVSYVNGMAVERNDVSLIPGVGAAIRQNLSISGFRTVLDVADAPEEALTQVHRVGGATARKMRASARAIELGAPIRKAPTDAIRRGKTEVFFDFEGTDPRIGAEGLEVVNYLIGALVRRPQAPARFEPFFASTFEDEERVVRGFFAWAANLDDPVFYHWHHYERTHLMRMAEYYHPPESQLDLVMDRLVDLSPLTTKSFAFPTYGEGLKDIARCLGFSWRQEDVDALASVALYLSYVASGGTQEETRQKILDYNEDDCRATMHVFDWLLAQEG